MSPSFIPYGEPYPDLNPDHIEDVAAKKTLAACLAHCDFDVIELRRLARDDEKVSDIIVVDCVNDQVPSRNTFGIKNRERLALVFSPSSAPEARALRADFPVILHTQHSLPDDPSLLCLYFEPWHAVERTWTAEKHLQRILWWLTEASKGSLHRDDQPVEQLYFSSPYKIVLPPDFDIKISNKDISLTFVPIKGQDESFKMLRGFFVPLSHPRNNEIPKLRVVQIDLPAVVHQRTEYFPNTLGKLHDQMELRGAEFFSLLKEAIAENVPSTGIEAKKDDRCLILLSLPIIREAGKEPERFDVFAFLTTVDMSGLGNAAGVLSALNNRYYVVPIVGSTLTEERTWRELPILPVEVKREVDLKFVREASLIEGKTSDFKGVLAGVGALGSTMLDLWIREGWGNWGIIDPDTVEHHNIVRHVARNHDLGRPKVEVVKQLMESTFHPGYLNIDGPAKTSYAAAGMTTAYRQ